MSEIQDQEIEVVKAEALATVASATSIVVASDSDLAHAASVLKDVAGMKKSLEDRRTFFVKPLNDQVKKINALFQELAVPLVDADFSIRKKVADYRNAQAEAARNEQERLNEIARQEQARLAEIARVEQARLNEIARKEQERLDKIAAKEQAKADKAAEKKGTEAPVIVAPTVVAAVVAPVPVVVAPVIAAPPKTVGNMVGRKVWKFKVTDPAIVPRSYLYVDEQMLRAAVRDGVREIPGVSIYQEEEITIR